MSLLRQHLRDPELPQRAGDSRLVVLDEQSLLTTVSQVLLVEGAPRPVSARWEFARWKPGVSLTTLHELGFEDGSRAWVGCKRYVDGKASSLAERGREDARLAACCTPLRPSAVNAGDGLHLWSPVADRVLRGFVRLYDRGRLGRLLSAAGWTDDLHLRHRRTQLELLRYKPERRAVLRLDFQLRDASGGDHQRQLAARLLPEAQASRALAARALPRSVAGLFPRLVAQELHSGLLLEEWLQVRAAAPGDWSLAALSGRLLAQLHGAQLPQAFPDAPEARHESYAALWRLDPALENVASRQQLEPLTGARCVIHGDFHADQLAESSERPGEWRLLDLDNLGAGHPVRDLASWSADRIAQHETLNLEAASGELVDAYREAGGAALAPGALELATAVELRARAAAMLRRLELGAVERAKLLLERCLELSPPSCSSSSRPVVAPLQRALGELVQRSGERAPLLVRRVEAADDGALTLHVVHGEQRLWLEEREGLLRELCPGQERLVPLARLLREPPQPEVELQTLSWRPGRRLVLREDRGRSRAVIKGYRSGRMEAALERHHAAERLCAAAGLSCPRLTSWSISEQSLRFEWLRGRPLVLEASSAGGVRRLGTALRTLQESDPGCALQTHLASHELLVLQRHALRFKRARGVLPFDFERVLIRLAERVLELPVAELVPAHRDLHDGQLVVQTKGLALLDFDLMCQADNALDSANLLAHLSLASLQCAHDPLGAWPHALDERGARSCGSALLEGLGRSLQAGFVSRLNFYQAASLMRLALVYGLRPRWQSLSRPLIGLAEGLLDEL